MFLLDALQPSTYGPSAIGSCAAAATSATAASSVLLVYGGVNGSSWLTDLNMLVLEDMVTGDYKLSVLTIPCSSSHHTQLEHCAAVDSKLSPLPEDAAVERQLPAAVRDFAACACGHNQFVIAGGFDGEQQTLHLQLCVLTHEGQQEGCKTGDAPVASSKETEASYSSSTMTWCQGWHASWQSLQPRNLAPVGRCHHSICHYAAAHSLVMFGGWADKQGCLNDVWLFHQDHMEWWQPEVAGV